MAVDVQNESDAVNGSLLEATRSFGKIGLLSFGGPAAQIALMHRVLVDEKKWLSEQQFLNALSFCMLLPGPEAMQLATYAGWRTHGVLGGLIAGLLFVLPGAFVILGLAASYVYFGDAPLVSALFLGVKAAVIAIVIEALLKVSRKALLRLEHWIIAGAAFVGIFFLALPFPAIIAVAAVYGAFRAGRPPADHPTIQSADAENLKGFGATLRTIFTWLTIWWVPLLLLVFFAPNDVLSSVGLFFSKLAVVTFGGAYAVLAYMAQDVVNQFGWLTAGEMMDGLGLAETTPGPLILVTQFVGFLAGFSEGGFWWGVAAAVVTLWATFVPCFLWIFAGAPYIEWISSQPRLKGALNGITAAVVGVILNLSLWFALHVAFRVVAPEYFGIFHLWVPDVATLDWRVIVLSIFATLLLFWCRWGVARVLGASALAGLALGSL